MELILGLLKSLKNRALNVFQARQAGRYVHCTMWLLAGGQRELALQGELVPKGPPKLCGGSLRGSVGSAAGW